MAKRFAKYHGTGNDFILLISSEELECPEERIIRHACTRHTGIGADGIMIVCPSEEVDFKVDYYNSDGKLGSLCGNGARCAVHFAQSHGLFEGDSCTFEAADGQHDATIDGRGWVTVHFRDVEAGIKENGGLFFQTGSPHLVIETDNLESIAVEDIGASIRNGAYLEKGGCNVNWVNRNDGVFRMRTYERGVEGETLSCGTGAVAVALFLHTLYGVPSPISMVAPGGVLKVAFEKTDAGFNSISLNGPATHVYNGIWPW